MKNDPHGFRLYLKWLVKWDMKFHHRYMGKHQVMQLYRSNLVKQKNLLPKLDVPKIFALKTV